MKNVLNWLKKQRNISDLDRLGRVIISEVLILVAYFWLGGLYALLCWLATAALILSAITGFSLAYYRTNTASFRPAAGRTKLWQALPLLIVIAALPPLAGRYSIPPTTRTFLNDFAVANVFLKQTIYDSDNGTKELTAANFTQWQAKFSEFSRKYGHYRPFVIKGDRQFSTDLRETAAANESIQQLAYAGDMAQVNSEMDKLQDRWLAVFQRNGLNFGLISLINYGQWADDLSSSGENLDAPHILVSYPQADLKLQELEQTMDPSDELTGLRAALENLTKASQRGDIKQMPQLGRDFKQAYLRLYMK